MVIAHPIGTPLSRVCFSSTGMTRGHVEYINKESPTK